MPKIRPLLGLLVLPLAFLIHPASADQREPTRGGTLTVIGAEPPSLLSLANITLGTRDISAKITEGLLTFDDNFAPQPLLATSWQVSKDGLRYTFTLRSGVQWHDGKTFSAADVAYSLQEIKRVNPRGRTTFTSLQRVETPDPLTAVIVLSSPAPYLLRALSSAETPIVPKHIYEQGADAAAQNGNAPIGTGPFRFKQWVRGAYMQLERNPNYWDHGKPYLDAVNYRFASDPSAVAAALETGAADFSTSLSLNDVARLRDHPKVKAEPAFSPYLNNITAIEFNLKNIFLSDVRVRQGIAHAIDQNFLNKAIYQGYAQPLGTPIPSGLSPFHDASLRPYAYDLAAANRLLDDAGFKKGADGKRFAVTLDYFPTATLKQVAEYVKAALSRVGIQVTVRSQDLGVFIQRVYTKRDFDFEINGVGTLFDPTIGVQRLYSSKDLGKGIAFVNAAGYANAEVDQLLEQAAIEQVPARRIEQFNRIQRIVMTDLPLLPLVAIPRGNASSRRAHAIHSGVEGSSGSLASAWVEQ